MSLNVGELQATLGINTKGFSSGIKSAKQEIEQFTGKLGQGVETASGEATDGMDAVTKTSEELTEALEDTGKQAEETAEAIEQVGEESEKTGKKAGTAKETFNGLKSLLGTLGVGFSVTAIISALQQVVDKIKEANTEVETFDANLQYLTGTTGAEADRLTDLQKKLAFAIPVEDYNDLNKALASIYKMQGVDTSNDDQLLQLSEELLALKLIFQDIDVATTGSNLNDMFTKWGVGVDEYAQRMAELRQISQTTYIPFDDLVTSMSQLDDMADILDISLDDLMGILGNMDSKAEFDEFVSGADQMTTQFTATLAENGGEAGREYVKNMFKSAMEEAGNTENITEAGNILMTTLGLNSKTAKRFAETAQAYVGGTGTGLGEVISNVEASKTDNGNWSAEQLGWQNENMDTIATATSSMADATDDIVERTNELYKQGYTFDTEKLAESQRANDLINDMNTEIQNMDAPNLVKNISGIATIMSDLKTGFDEKIIGLFKQDTSAYVTLNVETTDGYARVTTSQQNAVASVNNPTY